MPEWRDSASEYGDATYPFNKNNIIKKVVPNGNLKRERVFLLKTLFYLR